MPKAEKDKVLFLNKAAFKEYTIYRACSSQKTPSGGGLTQAKKERKKKRKKKKKSEKEKRKENRERSKDRKRTKE